VFNHILYTLQAETPVLLPVYGCFSCQYNVLLKLELEKCSETLIKILILLM